METNNVDLFLIQLVLILCSARLCGELVAYWRAPAVIGELLAGILIGPSLFGLVDNSTTIQLLAEIGIILLLFEVGLETDIRKLTSAGAKATAVAATGVILPFAFGLFAGYYLFHFSLLASLFIGSTLTATSIGITLRVLRDLKRQGSHESQIIVGAAVLDDVIGIILLAILYEFSSSGVVNFWVAGKVLIFIALFFLIAPPAVKLISLTIKKWNEKSDIPGLLPTMIISLILLFAWIAHGLGAPELLGGFAAGLALSKHFHLPFLPFLPEKGDFSHRVEEQMRPIIHLFTPIFFVAIGLSLNLQAIAWGSLDIWYMTGVLLALAILGKILAGFSLVNEKVTKQIIIGTAMVPRGEVGLIFANVGLLSGALHNDAYTAVILVIALTTLLAPFMLRYLYDKMPALQRP